MKNYAIVLSGGVGSRTGLAFPKQYMEIRGKKLIQYVIDKLQDISSISGYVIVADEKWEKELQQIVCGNQKMLGRINPGKNRQESIYNALLFLKDTCADDDIVLIQDAVRPNTSYFLYEECIRMAQVHEGCMPVIEMKDTIYFRENGDAKIKQLEREKIFAGQAPEAFRFAKYLEANEKLLPDEIYEINGSTEPAILAGMDVVTIPGEENNYKITTQYDILRFKNDSIEY